MRRRVIVCLGLLLALCLLGDAIAMLCLRGSIRQLSALADSHAIQTMRAELTANGVRIETDLLAQLSGAPAASARHEDSLRRFAGSLSRCEACHHAPLVQAELDEIRQTFAAYRAAAAGLVGGDRAPADASATTQARALADELMQQATRMSDRAALHIDVRSTEAAASISHAWLVLLGTLVAALAASGAIAWHLKSRLTRPVEALLSGVERLRRGVGEGRLHVEGDEEFQRLGEAFSDAYANLKIAERGVYQAEKMAAVGRLAAGVAHEVGNPLASISSVAQMMRRQALPPEQVERIDVMLAQVDRISAIVRNLLSFSRSGAPPRGEAVQLGQLLERTVRLMRFDPRGQSVEISCDLPQGPAVLTGDADRLQLVFSNIILNAFDALNSGGDRPAQLRITLVSEGEELVVRFADTGSGMTPEQVESALDPFFTTKEPGEGTGLGLWICYQVVREHHGSLQLTSAAGEGTTVEVRLPRGVRPPDPGALIPPIAAEADRPPVGAATPARGRHGR